MFKVDLPPDTGPMYTYTTCCECDQLSKRIAELEADNERLRTAHKKIVSYCCDRHRVMMLGVQGFNTIYEIAKAALAAKEG